MVLTFIKYIYQIYKYFTLAEINKNVVMKCNKKNIIAS